MLRRRPTIDGLRDYGADGQFGLEPTPELYIDHLVEVFREVRRVLKDDGVLVLNLGDSYSGGGGYSPTAPSNQSGKSLSSKRGPDQAHKIFQSRKAAHGYKPKDLMGIPWRVALALQADGWWLRSAMPWTKASAMPESVQDRPTTAHEYIFLLAKSKSYYWDAEAIRQNNSPDMLRRAVAGHTRGGTVNSRDKSRNDHNSLVAQRSIEASGRNYRTTDLFNTSLDLAIEQQRTYLAHLEHVRDKGGLMLDERGDPIALRVNPGNFKGAHFAVFPPELVEPFVRAGTSEKGQCPECGAAWVRVVEKNGIAYSDSGKRKRADAPGAVLSNSSVFRTGQITATHTTGWRPTCSCDADPIPQTVLDPFGGAMTTMMVADRLGRDGIACELNRDYAEMGRQRLVDDGGMFMRVMVE